MKRKSARPNTAHIQPLRRAVTVIMFSILLLATVIRMYRAEDYVEFRGDQGSAGVVVYESWLRKSVPLVGPTVSTGQRPGPAYYYLIAPWLIGSNWQAVAPSYGMIVMGVLSLILIYRIAGELFSPGIGIVLISILAISPKYVDIHRTIWNPNPVPFFTILIIAFLLRFRTYPSRGVLFWIGAASGINVQLHYGNVLTMVLVGALLIWFGIRCNTGKGWDAYRIFSGVAKIVSVYLLGIITVLSPFLVYEYTHGFEDVRSLAFRFIGPLLGQATPGLPPNHSSIPDMAVRVFRSVVYVQNSTVLAIIAIVTTGLAVLSRRSIVRYLAVWFGLWLVSFRLYPDFVSDHYLYGVWVLPVFLIGNSLQVIGSLSRPALIVVSVALIGLMVNGYRTEVRPRYEIPRAIEATSEMTAIAGNRDFAFTTIRSPSFSDYHLRYFFRVREVYPKEITDPGYPFLFVVCESSDCPNPEELSHETIRATCYDHVCNREYPQVHLTDWVYDTSVPVIRGRLYVYRRG